MLPLVIKVEQQDGNVRQYAFADSPVSIGRSPLADLQLTEPFISRWEGTVRFDDREISYFSLQATNSTYLDGRALDSHEQDIPLGVASVLTLGELKLRFAREPVPQEGLRRKGKRRPVREDSAAAGKTVYLDRADAWTTMPPKPKAAEPPRRPPPKAASFSGDSAATQLAPLPAGSLAHRQMYQATRTAWLHEARAQLAALPQHERGPWLLALHREEPSLFTDPDLHTACIRAGIRLPQEIPELQAWLREIARGVLPDGVQFDSRLVLSRVLMIVEALVQSLSEVHQAQDSVRERWLGQSPRRSVLQSDKPNVVLAYLLNPQADWNERLQELEQTIRDVVTHELALFKAMLEGARALLEAVSPETIAAAEQAGEAESDEDTDVKGLFARWLDRRAGALELRLWHRLLNTYAELRDGDRFERVFLGRGFARSYLAALGQGDRPPRAD